MQTFFFLYHTQDFVDVVSCFITSDFEMKSCRIIVSLETSTSLCVSHDFDAVPIRYNQNARAQITNTTKYPSKQNWLQQINEIPELN